MKMNVTFMLLAVLFTSICTDAEETNNTPVCKCEEKLFACQTEFASKCTCIPNTWICDGDYDCEDLSDESYCEMSTCLPNWLQCGNGKCIKDQWRCDGENDCLDGSDEQACPEEECDATLHKRCTSGQCLPMRWWCDGDIDCPDKSDETGCDFESCKKDEFQCDDHACIDSAMKCDGDFDCRDGSDEKCADVDLPDEENIHGNITCEFDEFSCDVGGKEETVFLGGELALCIPLDYLCDGDMDCGNGLDEQNCSRPCTDEEFRCASGQCISLADHCDGYSDCGDETDEVHCPENEACIEGEFRCDSGICISRMWRCDGQEDCNDGSDENECVDKTGCDKDQFECRDSSGCIRNFWRCDGEVDCEDESDELYCQCQSDQYQCASGQCIAMVKLCDGAQDCDDGSDERSVHSCNHSLALGPNVTLCAMNSGGCEHLYRETPNGSEIKCICEKGFQLSADMRSCEDINECETYGLCSQTCNNTVGSFSCSCQEGYLLGLDRKSCKASGPAPALIFTNRIDICRIDPYRLELKPILSDLENAVALDYHIEKGYLFWSDVTFNKIMRSTINGSHVQEVVSSSLENPGGIAVDWIHDLLYWSDSATSRIEVSHLDGSNRKVLIWQKLEKPRAIVLHPHKGFLFWTDWGNTPCLERAAMDGSMRTSLASQNVYWPNGLTIDYSSDNIYWSDAKYHVIETANLDGNRRRAITSRGLPHPFGVTVFEDKVYWTDWQTKSVKSANKFTGDDVSIIRNSLHFPMDIKAYHPLRQPQGENKCLSGGCSHLCLPRPNNYTCACPTGFRNVNATQCADEISSFLVFTRQTDIRRISFDGGDQADAVVPLKGLKNAVALDWHSEYSKDIFWSDVGTGTISKAEWNGNKQEVLISSSLSSPAGIAIDWITNKIYWTDSGLNRIEVAVLDGSMRCILIWTGLDRPRAIVVHPKNGYMFWTDWGKEPKIERSGMDGLNRISIVSSELLWPNGLTTDHTTDRLFWADAGKKMIESCDVDGRFRRVIVDSDLPHPFGITLDESKIYWTDWQAKSISYANKATGLDRGVLHEKLSYLMDIRYYHTIRPQSPNPCSVRNGGCSHLCLLASNPNPTNETDKTSYSCACPTGFSLGVNRRNCNTTMNKFLVLAHRSDIRVVSLDVPYSADVKLNIRTPIRNVVDVAFDPTKGHLYWSDIGSRTISRSLLSLDFKTEETVISSGLEVVNGLTVDVIGRLLYWTVLRYDRDRRLAKSKSTNLTRRSVILPTLLDDGRDTITVSTLDGGYKRILISTNMDSPRAIALHYDVGYMYWTDWGSNPAAKIERASLDGSNRSVIISSGLAWPNAITIDKDLGWVIWGDAQIEKIERSDLLGSDRQIIYSHASHPYSVTTLDGFLYWTDWQTRSIEKLNLYNTTQVETVTANMPSTMGIKAVSMGNVNEESFNRCGETNGGCSHLCLRSPVSETGFTCACSTGVSLQSDGKTCLDLPQEYLLFATRLSIRRASLEADLGTDVVLPIKNLENVIALDYHFRQQLLFFTDTYLNVIKKCNLNESDVRTIVSKNLTTTDGIAVDWVANNLYWTDAGTKMISVSRLDGGNRKVIIFQELDEPRALIVHPSRGIMFWTDWGEKPSIEKSYLDGSNRKILVKKNIYWPNGLTVDYANSRLFWVDAHHASNRMEVCDFNGKRRRIIVSPVPHGFSITYLYNTLYWTDWRTHDIHSAVLGSNGSKRTTIIKDIDNLMDIKAVSSSRQTGTNPCDVTTGYGGCTHLCLMRGPRDYVCSCPDVAFLDDSISFEEEASLHIRNCTFHLHLFKPLVVVATTTEEPITAIPAATTSVAVSKINKTKPEKETPSIPVIHLVAAVLGAVFAMLLLCAVFVILICKYFKKKCAKSNGESCGSGVIFRNRTYSVNSKSATSYEITSRRSPTPDAQNAICNNEREQRKLPLNANSQTNDSLCNSNEIGFKRNSSSNIQGRHLPPIKSTNICLDNRKNFTKPPERFDVVETMHERLNFPVTALPLLEETKNYDNFAQQDHDSISNHEYATIPFCTDDGYQNFLDVSHVNNSKSSIDA